MRGLDCTAAQKAAAWKAVMRQLNDKVAKTGTLFLLKRKGAAEEAAQRFSFKAYSQLTPVEQARHSWTCTACPQSQAAQKVFGTAVLCGNQSGAPRGLPCSPALLPRPSPAPLGSLWALLCRHCGVLARACVEAYVVRRWKLRHA